MESCPWTQCQTQLNGAAVKSTNHFIKVNPKVFSFVQFLSLLYQDIAKVLIDMPILFLVRLCKCLTVSLSEALRFFVPLLQPLVVAWLPHYSK